MARKPSKTPAKSYDLDLIRQAAAGRWPEILSRLGGVAIDVLDGRPHPCPKCGGSDRFRLIDQAAGACLCNQCFREKNGDGFAVLQWLSSIGFKLAMERVAGYLGIEPSRDGKRHGKAGTGDPAEHLAFLPWDEGNHRLAAIWCAVHKPGTSPAAILACHGRMAMYRERHKVIALPIWGEKLNTAGEKPIGWTLYHVGGGPLPKFTKDKPVEWVKVKNTFGSREGLIGPVERFSGTDHQPMKVEGPTDLLALLSLDNCPPGLPAFTNANGCGTPPAPWLAEVLGGTGLTIIHDADQPGVDGAKRWAAAITGSRWLTPPYSTEATHGKDLRDWLGEGKDDDGEIYITYPDRKEWNEELLKFFYKSKENWYRVNNRLTFFTFVKNYGRYNHHLPKVQEIPLKVKPSVKQTRVMIYCSDCKKNHYSDEKCL